MSKPMSHTDYILKLIEYKAEFEKAVILLDYPNIEYFSKRIGLMTVKFLNDNKMYIKK